MQIGDRFIGRDREVAQLELAIGRGDDGLRFSMLTGPSGLGKTTLANVVVDRARETGFHVAFASGRAGSLSTPFVPWIEAFPGMTEALAQPVIAGQRIDMEQLGIRLVAHLADLAADQPILLVFDDVQALDESSLALLPYATGISERANISMMFIEQSDAVGVSSSYRAFINGLLARRVVQHLELGPMSDASIRELVQAVLELDTVDEVPVEIIERAEGNPWFAQELACAWQRGEEDIPVNVASAATARLNVLDDIAQDIVNAIAVCPDGAYIGWLERMADQKPRQFVRTMESIHSTGLIDESGDFISISHPIYQQALLQSLSVAMRRALHAELVEIIESTQLAEVVKSRSAGFHYSACGKPSDAVHAYLRAARVNELAGQLHEALSDQIRALEIEAHEEQRIALLKDVAFAASQLGDDRAVTFWKELGRLASASNNNDLYAYALFQQFWTSYEGTAIDRLERAASLGVDEYGWAARSAAYLAAVRGDFASAINHDKRALELARSSGDSQLEVLALEKIGNNLKDLGNLHESIEYHRLAVTRATKEKFHSLAIFARIALAHTLVEQLNTEQAVDEMDAALKYVDDINLVRLRPLVLGTLAHVNAESGRLTDASMYAEQARMAEAGFDVGRDTALIALLRAHVAAEVGDATVAGDVIADAEQMVADQGVASWADELAFFRVQLDAYYGNNSNVVARMRDIATSEATLLSRMAVWVARRAVLVHQHELHSFAVSLIEEVQSDAPFVAACLSEVQAIGRLMHGDVNAMSEVVNTWRAAGRHLDSLRSELVGVAFILNGQTDRHAGAIEALKALRSAFVAHGAEHDANFVAALLRSCGTRSRAKTRSTTVGNLTKRELEIARLVASGLRNSEVAQQLYLAEKTVAAHLSNIYGKLEVRSRVKLTAWLQEHDDVESLVS